MSDDHDEKRMRSVLFNDVTRAPVQGRGLLFSNRKRLADYLWEQGWRRDVRPEDVTEHMVGSMLDDGRCESIAEAES